MELRLESSNSCEVLDGCYVAVKVGDVQKQSPFSPSRTYRFSNSSKYGRVDVFKRIGTGTMSLKENDFDLRVACDDPVLKELRFNVGVSFSNKEISSGKKGGVVNHAKVQTREYMDKHGLEELLADAMLKVVTEQPDNPYMALSGIILSKQPSAFHTQYVGGAGASPGPVRSKSTPITKVSSKAPLLPHIDGAHQVKDEGLTSQQKREPPLTRYPSEPLLTRNPSGNARNHAKAIELLNIKLPPLDEPKLSKVKSKTKAPKEGAKLPDNKDNIRQKRITTNKQKARDGLERCAAGGTLTAALNDSQEPAAEVLLQEAKMALEAARDEAARAEAKKKKEEDVRNKARNSFEGGANTGQLGEVIAKNAAEDEARAEAKKKEEYLTNKARNSFEGGVNNGQLQAQVYEGLQGG